MARTSLRFMPPLWFGDLFTSLSDAGRLRLERISQRHHFSENQSIFGPGSKPAIWIIESGPARLYLPCVDNEAAESREVVAGEVFGITEALAQISFALILRAESSCVLDCIESSEFIQLLRDEPLLRAKLLHLLSEANIDARKELSGRPRV